MILLLILIGVPALSLFIKKTYGPDMIFRRIYLYFIYWWIKTWRKKDRYKRYIIKPFICVYCYNTWLSIFSFFLFLDMNILFLPIFIGLSYIILELFMKILK